MGIKEVVIAWRSPWQNPNPYCERVVGSLRRECLDHVIVLNEAHLRRILSSFADYYNEHRPHPKLGGRTPAEISSGRLRQCRRIEPRPRWRRAPVGCSPGIGLKLDVNYVDGRKHLPVIELR
jgi:hypothetical protein